jgi:hypothetical protein
LLPIIFFTQYILDLSVHRHFPYMLCRCYFLLYIYITSPYRYLSPFLGRQVCQWEFVDDSSSVLCCAKQGLLKNTNACETFEQSAFIRFPEPWDVYYVSFSDVPTVSCRSEFSVVCCNLWFQRIYNRVPQRNLKIELNKESRSNYYIATCQPIVGLSNRGYATRFQAPAGKQDFRPDAMTSRNSIGIRFLRNMPRWRHTQQE